MCSSFALGVRLACCCTLPQALVPSIINGRRSMRLSGVVGNCGSYRQADGRFASNSDRNWCIVANCRLYHADGWQGTLQHLDTGRFRPSQLIIDIPRSDFTLTSINHAHWGRKGMRVACTLGVRRGEWLPRRNGAFQSHEVIRSNSVNGHAGDDRWSSREAAERSSR
jgi:hypothetical protein